MTGDQDRSALGRLGGLSSAAKMTPEQRTERARKAVATRWRRENERRTAEGIAPTKPTRQPLDAEELEPFLAEVDERFGVDYPWPNKMSRKRQAILLARQAAARLANEAFTRRDDS
ncbi:MAG TPA: hypothetical protein VIG35_09770 [Gaiellaceae bacterium]|jgi:hypothetical protein